MYQLLVMLILLCKCHFSLQSSAIINTLRETCDAYDENGYYDDDLGHVKIDTNVYCSVTTLRVFAGHTCCTPEPPTPASKNVSIDESFPNFFFYPPSNQSSSSTRKLLNWRQEEPAKQMLSSYEKIVYLIHGWNENIRTSVWLNRTIKAWTKSRRMPVIVVDWSSKNKKFSQTAANTVTVGRTVGFSLFKWNILNVSEIVGHSAGAQVVGEVGNYVKSRNGQVKRCVVLDPAGPGFDTGPANIRISRDDCQVVEAIHSSSPLVPLLGPLVGQYGTMHKVGSCDYYLNCGNRQSSDCEDPKKTTTLAKSKNNRQITSFCSHHLAPLIYAEQVSRNCSFQSFNCPDCSGLRVTHTCTYYHEARGLIPPDSNCTSEDNLSFFVKTAVKYPYC